MMIPQLIYADTINYYPPGYDIDRPGFLYAAADAVNQDVLNQETEKEGPVRRFEVTFFISLPFVFIANFLTLHIYEVIRQRDFNVSVWEEHAILLPAATFAVTSAVAFRAAYTGSGSSERDGAIYPAERSFFLCAVKNY